MSNMFSIGTTEMSSDRSTEHLLHFFPVSTIHFGFLKTAVQSAFAFGRAYVPFHKLLLQAYRHRCNRYESHPNSRGNGGEFTFQYFWSFYTIVKSAYYNF